MSSIRQSSFSKGEITPSLHARADLAMYTTALRTLRNAFTMRQGGFQNRSGTTFCGEVKDSSKTVRLIEWIFNSEQAYVLELGNLYLRVWKNGALVETAPDVPFELVTPYLEADLDELNYTQSADIMTIVHKDYAPRELARISETSWTLTTITFGPSIAAPAGFAGAGATAGFEKNSWWITAINAAGEESLSSLVTSNTRATSGTKITLSWTADADATEYRLYKKVDPYATGGTALDAGFTAADGITGLLRSFEPSTVLFIDDGSMDDEIDIDFIPTNTTARDPFSTAGEYPGAVIYSQQRRIFASSTNHPERVWASYIGGYANFEVYDEITDSCHVQFDLVGRQVNEIMHLIETGQLLALTIGSEWSIDGNDSGIIVPTAINPKQQTFYGSKFIRPLNIGEEIYFIQSRGTRVRSLGFDFGNDGYKAPDLTIFSSHLFDKYTLEDWCFQQNPQSIVWVVRSDGKLLGLTTIKDQEMLAWHQHDFSGGLVEKVCAIPEGSEDSLYLVIKRTINGSTKRYIERLSTRELKPQSGIFSLLPDYSDLSGILDAIFMDSTLSYDGRNTAGIITMTLSGGTDWTHLENLTLTASSSFFVAGDVGNAIHITDPVTGVVIRCSIEAYTNDTVVTVKAHKLVPTGLRSVATTNWGKAVDEISGLDHLEGEDVSVFADGFVIGSPNNPEYPVFTVTSGAITLEDPRVVIHVGLPYLTDAETLDIENGDGETISDRAKTVTSVSCHVEKTRGLWVGARPPEDDDDDPLEGLQEPALRNLEDYDEPTELASGVIDDIQVAGEANLHGRVFIRQVDPIPMTILSIVPSGYIPKAG